MTDIVTKKKRSEMMRAIKSRHTGLEKKLASILRYNGIRYQSQPRMFGHPDFRVKSTRVIIFCDSSFWHGRNEEEISGRAFKTNRKFWTKKLKYNKERDEKINRVLKKRGWTVLRFWDDDILKRPSFVMSKINRHVKLQGKK